MRRMFMAVVVGLLAGPVSAVDLNGSIVGDDYSVVATQTINTGFGNNNELNAAWAKVESGTLYLVFTGNLQNNFNRLNVFIDSQPGGENVLTNDIDFGGNNPTNDIWAGKHAGLTFDAGFAADYMISLRHGDAGGFQFNVDFNSVGNTGVVEVSMDIFGGSSTGATASVGASGLGVAFDNSNIGGVIAGTGAANQVAAEAVQTGVELAIPLSAIGNPSFGDIIRISAMINSQSHDYLSNQILGGLPAGTGNLGGDGAGGFTGTLSQIDFNNFAGNQFFELRIPIPEPTSLALVGLSLIPLTMRRSHPQH